GKTIPNSNIIIVSENGTVGTTQAKANGEFQVEISPMVSGTNIEVLVYDKKIFSILYKFEKLVVKKDLFTS
ncbi:Ig-like domain-containing protein, partial [uncultured Clostridium sp.]|uniref:Ig-like domain-containing protein n=1 Tax=uncultured Clostridium sp. TaxID=59620 RepID=UPI0025EE45DF